MILFTETNDYKILGYISSAEAAKICADLEKTTDKFKLIVYDEYWND